MGNSDERTFFLYILQIPAASWRPLEVVGKKATEAEVDSSDDSIAFLQYTSGSTSDPKGVIVGRSSIAHNNMFVRRYVSGTSSVMHSQQRWLHIILINTILCAKALILLTPFHLSMMCVQNSADPQPEPLLELAATGERTLPLSLISSPKCLSSSKPWWSGYFGAVKKKKLCKYRW